MQKARRARGCIGARGRRCAEAVLGNRRDMCDVGLHNEHVRATIVEQGLCVQWPMLLHAVTQHTAAPTTKKFFYLKFYKDFKNKLKNSMLL